MVPCLVEGRLNARRLCRALNDTIGDPENIGASSIAKVRAQILDSLFGNCDPLAIEVEPPFWCDYGYNISIGKEFYCNFNCCILGNGPTYCYMSLILDCAKIIIGDRVLVLGQILLR